MNKKEGIKIEEILGERKFQPHQWEQLPQPEPYVPYVSQATQEKIKFIEKCMRRTSHFDTTIRWRHALAAIKKELANLE